MTRGEAFDKLRERFPGKVVELFIGETVKNGGSEYEYALYVEGIGWTDRYSSFEEAFENLESICKSKMIIDRRV